MNVLVACEESQEVCKAFRKKGHRAFSCDIVPCSGGHPEWHIQSDVIPLLDGACSFQTSDGQTHLQETTWDMIISFPPCTHLCVSGAKHFERKRADGSQREAIEFFMNFLNAKCKKIAVENPVGIISGEYIKKHFPDIAEKHCLPISPTQIIQPYWFGHPVSKKTCLWLKGLQTLQATNVVEYESHPGGFSGSAWYVTDENGKILSWKDPRTAKERSKTFPGVAKAMAEQWG